MRPLTRFILPLALLTAGPPGRTLAEDGSSRAASVAESVAVAPVTPDGSAQPLPLGERQELIYLQNRRLRLDRDIILR
jgi:hypothetical protein